MEGSMKVRQPRFELGSQPLCTDARDLIVWQGRIITTILLPHCLAPLSSNLLINFLVCLVLRKTLKTGKIKRKRKKWVWWVCNQTFRKSLIKTRLKVGLVGFEPSTSGCLRKLADCSFLLCAANGHIRPAL